MAALINSTVKNSLNQSMRASQDAGLGSLLAGFGTHTVTAGEQTAGTLDIDSGNASAIGMIVQIYRADVQVTADADISLVAGVLTVADGSVTYAVTENDVINYIVF